jgi:NDP-sugar pyrophosphorylase family protein
MRAAVLAGGAGTRLQPLTAYVPKQMIPLGGKLVVDYVVDYLRAHGIEEIIILTSHDDHKTLENYLEQGQRHRVKIAYAVADRLGTAGALFAAQDHFQETFVIYYGDVLLDLNLADMIEFHKRKRSWLTIALSTSVPIEYGVAKVEDDGRIAYFEEKPVLKEYPVNMGLFVSEPQVLKYCNPNGDLSADVIPTLIREGKPVFGYLTGHRHYDIGTFRNLEEVRRLIENGTIRVNNTTNTTS